MSISIPLIISAARGLLVVRQRGDQLLAAKRAVEAELVIPFPKIYEHEIIHDIIINLKNLKPRLPHSEQVQVADILERVSLDEDEVYNANSHDDEMKIIAFARQLQISSPEKIDLDADFIKEVRANLGGNDQTIIEALSLESGATKGIQILRPLSLAVADSVFDFGAAHVHSFIKDEGTQSLVKSVLDRVNKLDLKKAGDKNSYEITKSILSATLNGALDEQDFFKTNSPWLKAMLDGVIERRSENPELVLELFSGKGYSQLVGSLLSASSTQISDEFSHDFKNVVDSFITKTATIISEKPDLNSFFKDNWSSILQAVFDSASEHSLEMLQGDNPVYGKVLEAITTKLAEHENYQTFTSKDVYGLTSVVLAKVAENPAAFGDGDTGHWIATVADSMANTFSKGAKAGFGSKSFLQSYFSETLTALSKRPELLSNDDKINNLSVGILEVFSLSDSKNPGKLAKLAIQSALKTVTDNPALFNASYPNTIKGLTSSLNEIIKENSLSNLDAKQLFTVVFNELAHSKEIAERVAEPVVKALIKARKNKSDLLSANQPVSVLLKPLLEGVARWGNKVNSEKINDSLVNLLEGAFQAIDAKLGDGVNLKDTTSVLANSVDAWAQGRELEPRDLVASMNNINKIHV